MGSMRDYGDECRPKDDDLTLLRSIHTESLHGPSNCDITYIQRWLGENKGTCLYNVPATKNPLPRILPSPKGDRDDQCKKLGMGSSCHQEDEHHLCRFIYCKPRDNPHSCTAVYYNNPNNYASCSTGKVCLNGRCVRI